MSQEFPHMLTAWPVILLGFCYRCSNLVDVAEFALSAALCMASHPYLVSFPVRSASVICYFKSGLNLSDGT
jgi:hypothetical protein